MPLISSLPWQYPYMMANLRHLRLKVFLPSQYSSVWEGRFTEQIKKFIDVTDRGQRLHSFRVLIGSWHSLRILYERQLAIDEMLTRMRLRGYVQVRTRSLRPAVKCVIQKLNLSRRMRAAKDPLCQLEGGIVRKHNQQFDWEWEGGLII